MWSVSERSGNEFNSLYRVQEMGAQVMQWRYRQFKQVVGFECRRCVEGTGNEEVKKEIEIEHVGKLECVDKFCYLGDMTEAGGGAEEASRARVRCAWASSENYHQY